MKISLDYDDFSPLNHRFDLLEKLRKRYPGFKVTMFTVPWEIRLSPDTKGTPITEDKYKPWVDKVKKAQKEGWLEIAIHGLTHNHHEFEKLGYDVAKKRAVIAQKMFANVGIETNGMFKAPFWLLTEEGKLAIEDLGLTVMEDGYYNWNLKDEISLTEKKQVAHGHVHDTCGNGMEESYFRLIKVPKEAEWVHLKEILQTKTEI